MTKSVSYIIIFRSMLDHKLITKSINFTIKEQLFKITVILRFQNLL
jgi:hypothetical protein